MGGIIKGKKNTKMVKSLKKEWGPKVGIPNIEGLKKRVGEE